MDASSAVGKIKGKPADIMNFRRAFPRQSSLELVKMKVLFGRRAWLFTLFAVATLVVAWSSRSRAADLATDSGLSAGAGHESVKIEPYTGPPIYLPAVEQIAKPRIVTHETISEKYEDNKTERVSRQIARYSDDSFAADGKYSEFYPNGKPFIQGQFSEGLQDGVWTYYFDNGQLNRKAKFADGKPNGSWDIFRADGTLASKRSFKEGKRDGDWITYDEKGKQPLAEEHYADGKEDGV